MSHLRVSISAQRLDVVESDGSISRSFPVSTAKKGVGSEPNSNQTPLGWHRISEMIGGGKELGTHFVGRKPTGRVWKPSDPVEEKNLVLTRILRLDGEEPGNATSRDRYIYIHGTNREDRIGQPTSAGCVCLRNADVMELYELVTPGTRVEIIP
ncbi:MAG: L,D-transpeptidase [Verrucomicrobia bacterium]|nr:L,D-transpeptidase [Verrucomicrobiota bacterium]